MQIHEFSYISMGMEEKISSKSRIQTLYTPKIWRKFLTRCGSKVSTKRYSWSLTLVKQNQCSIKSQLLIFSCYHQHVIMNQQLQMKQMECSTLSSQTNSRKYSESFSSSKMVSSKEVTSNWQISLDTSHTTKSSLILM